VKRTIASTIPLLALLVAAPSARAQPSSNKAPLEAAKEQYLRSEQRAAEAFLAVFRDREKGQAVEPRELREKIRPLVEESFEARQRLQKAEVETLRRRLADIEQTIDNREKNKQAIVNARIEDVLNGKVDGNVQIEIGDDANVARGRTTPRTSRGGSAGEGASTKLDEQREPTDFDLETRQRLAKLDLQAAEEDYLAAEKDLSQARKLYETAAISESVLRSHDKDHRHAATELKRAKVRIEGLARQRAELEAISDAEIDEAMAEERQLMAKLHSCEAEVQTAQARVTAAEADVAKAKATREYREKQHQRMKELIAQKAVEPKMLDEAGANLETASADLDGAQAARAVALANVDQTKIKIEQIVAEGKAAEARVRAARLRRQRVGRHGQAETTQPAEE
jgi:hypothetical protein